MKREHFDACSREIPGKLLGMEDVGQFGLAVSTETVEGIWSLEVEIVPENESIKMIVLN
jgi:hypothetical protein